MKTSEQATTAEAPPGEALTAAETSEASSDAATSGDQHKLDVFSEAMPCGVGAESRPSLHECLFPTSHFLGSCSKHSLLLYGAGFRTQGALGPYYSKDSVFEGLCRGPHFVSTPI